MTLASKADVYALIGITLFGAEAAFSITHMAMGAGYPGFRHWPHDPIVDALTAVFALSGALSLWLRKRWMAHLLVVAIVSSFVHALQVSLSLQLVGIPFWLSTVVLARCAVMNWSRFQASEGFRKARVSEVTS